MCISSYIPQKPFDAYKWFYATKAPTESLGDPAVLLGLTSRMAAIADGKTKYSSDEFAQVLQALDKDISTPVDLSRRVGERNLMRNSGQYWRLFGLIPNISTGGVITLTPLAQSIAQGSVSQADFAASMIVSVKLPNPVSYTKAQIWQWQQHDLIIHPFKLILKILRELASLDHAHASLTVDELARVVVPMAADRSQTPKSMATYVLRYREDPLVVQDWPNCVPSSNDERYLGEYLRFLANFGYVEKSAGPDGASRATTKYSYVHELDYQVSELVDGTWSETSHDLIRLIQDSDITSAVTLASISRSSTRPNQQRFRRDLLAEIGRCPITGNTLPSVLQAAHIKPHSFGGPEHADNGLPLRADIHTLFDAGLLAIRPLDLSDQHARMCEIEISDAKVQSNYRELINKYISLPSITNMEYVHWRYQNQLLGVVA